ncbi:trypsin-like serine protease, partial [Thalassiosira oceanica]
RNHDGLPFESTPPCAAATAAETRSLRGRPQHHHHQSAPTVQREAIPSRNRIIGGDVSVEGRYPYAVSIQDDISHYCGGSLVAPDIVLSAAHCKTDDATEGVKVVVGRHNLEDEGDGEVIGASLELSHPDYDFQTTDNDYMIVVLERAVEADVDLVQISPDVVPVDAAVTVMGWGDTNIDLDISELAIELMETEVRTISNEECDASNGTLTDSLGSYDENYHQQITGNMLCAENEHRATDSCQGDSGGPLVIRTAVGEPDLQVGVVSWGVGCAHDAFPGVYARVSEKYEWIRAEVCNRSADPPAYFNCGELRTQETSPSASAWEEIVDEEFLTGLGIFNSHGNGDSSRHYPAAHNRAGVVRVASGGGTASLASRSVSLADTSYGRLRVSFSFYAMGTEHADDLCLDYELDNGAITGERCWSSLHAFQNNQWTDLDMEFNALPGARNISLRFRLKGDDSDDGVLVDRVTIEGRA